MLSVALESYDTKRREAVNCIVTANREESETRFLELVHKEAPDGLENFDEVITKEESDNISNVLAWASGSERDTLVFRMLRVTGSKPQF